MASMFWSASACSPSSLCFRIAAAFRRNTTTQSRCRACTGILWISSGYSYTRSCTWLIDIYECDHRLQKNLRPDLGGLDDSAALDLGTGPVRSGAGQHGRRGVDCHPQNVPGDPFLHACALQLQAHM